MTQPDARYWATVADEWQHTNRDRLWRAHSDTVNRALLARWLPATPVDRLLKTDVFDEAVSAGLDDLLCARARHVTGMDVSLETLRHARADHRAPVAADARHLPFATGAFDVVVSNSTLDHFATFAELTGSLREIHRVLKPGGQLLLTLDNRANPKILLRSLLPYRLLHGLGVLPYYVGVTCGPRRLRRTLAAAGFHIRNATAVMHAPRVLGVPLAGWLEHRAPAAQRQLLAAFAAFEKLERWPTRWLTGHFLAIHARKP